MINKKNKNSLNILLLRDDFASHANNTLDHINAFSRYSHNNVSMINPRYSFSWSSIDLTPFDVIVIHYSVFILCKNYLPHFFLEKLKRFRGLKVQFIQDDYRQVNEMVSKIKEIGVDLLYTLCCESESPKLWKGLNGNQTTIKTTLASYASSPTRNKDIIPILSRPLDVSYRSRECPFWLGKLAQEKVRIAHGFSQLAQKTSLKVDISCKEQDRIYGKNWKKFIENSKTILCTESGASIADFDREVESKVKAFCKLHPNVTFDEVLNKVLQPYEGNVFVSNISPRVFEAALLKTALICFEGNYRNIIQPDKHFIPLAHDFSNFNEVVIKIKDNDYLQHMVDHNYKDLILSNRYSFRTFINEFDDAISKEWENKNILKRLNLTSLNRNKIPLLLQKKTYLRDFLHKIFYRLYSQRKTRATIKLLRFWAMIPLALLGVFFGDRVKKIKLIGTLLSKPRLWKWKPHKFIKYSLVQKKKEQ